MVEQTYPSHESFPQSETVRSPTLLFAGFLFGHLILQSLAGLENRILAGRDLDLFPGLGVAAHTGGPLLHFEGTKPDQLDLVALNQSFGCLLYTSFCFHRLYGMEQG